MDAVAPFTISRAEGSTALARATAGLLDQLPSWFARREANVAYIESATQLSGLVASSEAEPIGVLLYRSHFAEAAEIHLMAVAPDWHRRGVGRALIDAVVSDLKAVGCEVLQVKTLGAAHPDRGYALTRSFYRAVGFLPLEETNELWPGTPCLIMVRSLTATP
ncbi:GNAT family N-acetyltransferase [Streptomyces tendae]|uniref:GNAT family N-acetyltransferase n=1 Tax=Streptomyces tendae TaxID=1932 RepID=UPI0037190974